MKTEALKAALSKHQFDAAFGGARRDEEKSRAKERVFSFRDAQHRWDPKNQRPELWNIYNGRIHQGESIRVFPLSNWTELDVWLYIHLEKIPVVPLYFAKPRPVVDRDGMLIMVDDERLPLQEGREAAHGDRAVPQPRLLSAVRRAALDGGGSLTAIIEEMLVTRTSERQSRAIDFDQAAAMEKRKREGYF